jgi:hypothetical protein
VDGVIGTTELNIERAAFRVFLAIGNYFKQAEFDISKEIIGDGNILLNIKFNV